ncbi:protoporphyrinogen oxidase HemJ [Dichotomicrobium thermohalophilum]|uniref:protoporphyrinogen oxidase HemJ n=1 Tax=Dichotomicrobium thermohalophilum TaxID=933063 RepID=UPI000E5B8EC0|nr:protoporphyrinogen oxidase HemJ [Dichotomicrobium thermohalophilum]
MYLYVKAFHVISIIAWMAGLLYLPRLFVYHAYADVGSQQSETFKLMEVRLLRYIMNPAMIASWVFGLLLLGYYGVINWSVDIWFHVKFLLVIILTGYHMVLARWRRLFAQDQNAHSAKFYRFMNEVPTVIMVVVVILAVARPF